EEAMILCNDDKRRASRMTSVTAKLRNAAVARLKEYAQFGMRHRAHDGRSRIVLGDRDDHLAVDVPALIEQRGDGRANRMLRAPDRHDDGHARRHSSNTCSIWRAVSAHENWAARASDLADRSARSRIARSSAAASAASSMAGASNPASPTTS